MIVAYNGARVIKDWRKFQSSNLPCGIGSLFPTRYAPINISRLWLIIYKSTNAEAYSLGKVRQIIYLRQLVNLDPRLEPRSQARLLISIPGSLSFALVVEPGIEVALGNDR